MEQRRVPSKHEDSGFQLLVNRISHYFTIFILAVALVSLGYWMMTGDFNRGWAAFTAVLIIACPCALAISSPFTLGNILRVFGRNKFYLKNYSVIEKLAWVDTVVFDKTGTITQRDQAETGWDGIILDAGAIAGDPFTRNAIGASVEPTSVPILAGVGSITGAGVPGGSGKWPFRNCRRKEYPAWCSVVLRTGGGQDGGNGVVGVLQYRWKSPRKVFIRNAYREGLEDVLNYLNKHNFRRLVLTGDHPGEAVRLRQLFGADAEIRFRQSPADKLNAIQAFTAGRTKRPDDRRRVERCRCL